MKHFKFISTLLIYILFSCSNDDDSSDRSNSVVNADGNIYNTITVENKIWMLGNLKTTTYNDETPVNEYAFGNDWHNGNTQVDYYLWANTSDLRFDYYGATYNHFAIKSGKLVPKGWRIPIDLENYLTNNGQSGTEGEAFKTTIAWYGKPSNDAIGFKGLPNGYIRAFRGPTLGGIYTWATSEINILNDNRTSINQSI